MGKMLPQPFADVVGEGERSHGQRYPELRL